MNWFRDRKYLGLLVLVLSLSLLVTACGGTEEPSDDGEAATQPEPEQPVAEGPQPGGTLRASIASDNTTLDPHMSSAAVDRQVFQSIFNTLVTLDEKLNIQPELAKSWEWESDTTITFELQEGVRFHDGEPFNAEAVKFNIERAKNPEIGSRRVGELASVETVVVVDEYTVRFELSEPYSPLLSILTDRSGMMLSPKAVEEKGDDFARDPVGTGPFVFVEWVKDDHLTVEKNADYWEEGLPYLDEIIYRPIPDASVRLINLRSGNLDIVEAVDPKDVAAVKSDANLVFSEVPGLGFTYVMFNMTKPPLDKVENRQALAFALDTEAIKKAAYFDLGFVSSGPIPPSSWAYDADFNPFPRDLEKAKELMAQAGNPDGFQSTLLMTSTPLSMKIAQLMQAQWAEAGIEVEIEAIEFGTLLDRIDAGDYNMASLGWSGRSDPDGNIHYYFHSAGPGNRNEYSNPEADNLIEQARATDDQAARIGLYKELQDVLATDVPMAFLMFPPQIKVYRTVVQDYAHVPDGMMRFKEVWLKQD